MPISLRRIEVGDKKIFAKWWRDAKLIALTSGSKVEISDEEVERFFSGMLQSRTDRHYMIVLGTRTIGHVALIKRGRGWYETQIIIGAKMSWGKGLGTEAIRLLMEIARQDGMTMVFLEVRPDNLRAIRAYEKCGFRHVKLVEHVDNPDLPVTMRMEWGGGKE